MPFAENLGTGGGSLDAQYGSSPTANTNAPLLLDPRTSGNFVYTPGTAGNYVAVPHSPSLNILGTEGTPFLSLPGVNNNCTSTAHEAALSLTGDMQIVMRLRVDSLDTSLVARRLLAKGAAYDFYVVQASGDLSLSVGGITHSVNAFTATLSLGVWYWIRVTLDIDNGANSVSTFEWAADSSSEPTSWTSLGTDTEAIITVGTNTEPLRVGEYLPTGTSRPQAMSVRRAIVRDLVAPATVFDADFTQQALGSRGFIESTGKLVSLVGNAAQIVDGTTYGFLPGVAGSYWSTPDSAALSITGDIDIRARISLNDWTPAADTMIVAKLASTGNQRSYALRLTTGGTFYFTTSPDGITGVNTLASAANTLTNGQTYWIRGSLDVDDGAGNRVANFYYAPDSETEPTVWTQIGTTVTVAGATSIFDGTAALEVGSFNGGQSPAAGRVYRAIIRGNLTSGTKAFDADFTRQLQFASSFTEATGKVVTTQGAARIERARDLEIVTRVAADVWAKPSSYQTFVSRRLGTNTWTFRTRFGLATIELTWWTTSGTAVTIPSTQALPFADGEAGWIKATLDVDNGSNGYTVSFYTAPDSPTEPTVWTPLGSPVTNPGAASIQATTVPVQIGGPVTFEMLAGKFFRSIIRNGIDGPAVLDLDFTQQITTGSQSVIEPASGATIPQAVQYAPNLGWGGAALNARYGSTTGADTNDPLLLEHDGTNYLYLPGVLGNDTVTGFVPALNAGGAASFRIEADLSVDNWSTFQRIAHVHGVGVDLGTLEIIGGLLRLYYVNAAGTAYYPTATVPAPLANGERGRVAAEVTSAGVVTFYYSTSPNGAWAQLGAPVTTAGGGFFNIPNPVVTVGSYAGVTAPFAGKMYRVSYYVAGTAQFDANFSTGITSGAQTTFTESSPNAATVTINRSTSGRKSVAVVRDVWLFGTDDRLEVPDNALLDCGLNDSLTVIAVSRQWATPVAAAALVSKKASTSNTADAGYVLRNAGAAPTQAPVLTISDNVGGGTASLGATPTPALGSLAVVAGVIDRATGLATVWANGVAGTSTQSVAGLDLSNSDVLRVGRISGSSTVAIDMELLAVAIFRRALSPAEIALVNTHYQSGPTAASNALLSESVWWIDAGRTAAAQINRSTSGRKSVACARCIWLLGTDDFFEVPASNLFDFAQGQDYTLLVLHRGWWAQGTNDTLLATSSSTTASAAGWAMSNSSGDPWQAGGRHGDGSIGVTAVAPRRDVGALTGTFLVRDTATDTLTAFTGSSSGTPVTDTTTGTIGNTNVMRLGRLSTTGTEYLDAEVVAAVVWRRALTTAERNAVLAYYGV